MAEDSKPALKVLNSDFRSGLIILLVFAILFVVHLVSTKVSPVVSVVSFGAFFLFLGVYILQANPALLAVLRKQEQQSPIRVWYLPLGLWVLSLLYGFFTGQFSWYLLIGGFFYCAVGAVLIKFLENRSTKLLGLDVILILFLWFPLEFGWTPSLNVPPVHGLADIYKFVGLALVIYFYFAIRRLPAVGFTYQLNKNDGWTAFRNFLLFMPIALIVGFPTHFIGLSQQFPALNKLVSSLLGIAFFIALPEEILFRGVIHNLIQERFAGKKHGVILALTISSVVFGLAHGDNPNPPFLDINFGSLGIWHAPWVYILLATVAGYFYGWTFIKTRKVTAAAIVHLLVDWTWSNFFSG